jgi:hypothetical protein
MSRSIWMRCEGSSRLRLLEVDAWRVVESQHIVSTRKLVDSDEEQKVLEDLIEKVKPPAPSGDLFAGLHYLLMTPFRHPPLRYGSRFGTREERGLWYGSYELETCFAEVAYYRLLFLQGTVAKIAPVTTELTAFSVRVRTRRGIDLTRAPFREFEAELASRTSYRATHAIGREMRAAGVQAFAFVSARSQRRGKNVALFEPVFATRSPRRVETWICTTDEQKVEVSKKAFVSRRARGLRFDRTAFEVAGKLPAPSC